MYKLIAIIICVLSFISAKAQYGDAYHAPNTQALQRDREQRQQASSNAHYNNVAPGSNGFSYNGTNAAKVNWPTKEERAAEAARTAASNKMREDAWAYQLKRKEEERVYYENLRFAEAQAKQQEKKNFVNTYVAKFAKSFLNKIDVNELAEINYFHLKVNKFFNENEYLDAIKALSNFKKDYPTASFDTLTDFMWRGRFFPFTTAECLPILLKRFPEQKEYLQQLELEMMSYYFGGHDQYFKSNVDWNYPKSSFEMMDEENKKNLFDRFDKLAAFYPEQSLAMAGNCRPDLNPFLLKCNSFFSFSTNDINERFESYKKVLYTVSQKVTAPSYTQADWGYFIDLRLRKMALWLIENKPEYVERLTVVDWTEIGKKQAMSLDYVAWAFRKDNDVKIYKNRFSNLKKAVIGDDFNKAPKSGKGEISFNNGDRYEGNFEDSEPNGKGIYYYYEGAKYEGDFVNGKFTGKGAVKWKNGNTYVGDWKNDEYHGIGTAKYTDGATYNGEFIKGKKNGTGTTIWANGTKYTGEYKDDNKEGTGTMTWADGESYTGKWKNDERNGEGTFTKLNGFYKKGKFKNNDEEKVKYYNEKGSEISFDDYIGTTKKGSGTKSYSNGDNYTGNFENSKPNGKGKYILADGSIYIGDFIDGEFSGKGKMNWANGNSYDGEWMNDKLHGKGTKKFKNGVVYVGEYINGDMHGKGTYIWADGMMYEGDFVHDKFEGKGKKHGRMEEVM